MSYNDPDGSSLRAAAGAHAEDVDMGGVLNEIQPGMSKRCRDDILALGRSIHGVVPDAKDAIDQNMTDIGFARMAPKLEIGTRGYTNALDIQFQFQWMCDPTFLELTQIAQDMQAGKRCHQNERLSPLWKTCIFAMNCWPTSIITIEHHLAYEPDPASRTESLLWSAAFCQYLTTILLNDRSQRHAPTVRTYLQYAVICRTNDTSMWPLEDFEDSRFLEKMVDAMKQDSTPRQSIPAIHQKIVRELYGPGSVMKRPDVSRVFEQIEKQLYRPDTPPVQQSGRICYKVRSGDLKCIVRAFDDANMGFRKPIVAAETISRWFSKGRQLITKPPSDQYLLIAVRDAAAHELKLKILYASNSGAGDAAPPKTPQILDSPATSSQSSRRVSEQKARPDNHHSTPAAAVVGDKERKQRPETPRPPPADQNSLIECTDNEPGLAEELSAAIRLDDIPLSTINELSS